MTPFRAPMPLAPQHLLTRRPTIRHLHITSNPFILLLPTRTSPPPSQRALPALPLMAAPPTFMLPAFQHPIALHSATKPPLKALPQLLLLPAQTPIPPLHLTGRARTIMAQLRAAVGPAGEEFRAAGSTGEMLLRAAAGVGAGSAEASSGDKLRAGGAGAGVAEEEAAVATAREEIAAADLTAGVGEDPGVGRGVEELAAEAEVGGRGEGFGVGEAALGAVPARVRVRVFEEGEGLVGPGLDAGEVEEGVAGGVAGPDGVGGADAAETYEAGGGGGGGGGEERFDL